jgi:zinc transport system substrate-binding protein
MGKALSRRNLTASMMVIFLVVILALSTVSCKSGETTDTRLIAAVTVVPQADFVKAVGGDKVNVIVMVPPGASPHTYEVTPDQMTQLSKAKMYAKVGSPVEFELSWMDKLIGVNKSMLVIDCSKGIQLVESQDPDEPGLDPHIWLSIKNAKVMVQNICDGLIQVDNANKSYYEKNCSDYLEKLNKLDQEIISALSDVKNRKFMVFHPAFGYFALDYDLTQIGVEQEGKEPDADYIVRLIKEAKDQNIHVVFVSPQYNTKSAESIAREIGGQVVIIDPLGENFIENMQNIQSAMKQAMQ